MKLFSFTISTDAGIYIESSWLLIIILILTLIVFLYIRRKQFFGDDSYLEINEAEIGVGSGKIKLKANLDDLQIGFKFWTELSTRKIGLPLDEEHDVIAEVYDSWYEFFKIARELIKTIPVSKIRHNETTKELVIISMHILNMELRPHLTKWQARYRRWWDASLTDPSNHNKPPQELQQTYPYYTELVDELKTVNAKLVIYTNYLQKMVGM